MICENCDRNNVVKAYCYYSKNVEYFEYVSKRKFSIETFAVVAVDTLLAWSVASFCIHLGRQESVKIWISLKPHLILALKEKSLRK